MLSNITLTSGLNSGEYYTLNPGMLVQTGEIIHVKGALSSLLILR